MLRLPEPMLARSGPIPRGSGWLYEPKLDGYRCMVCTHVASVPAVAAAGT